MKRKYLVLFVLVVIIFVLGFWGAKVLARQNTTLPSGVTTEPPLTTISRTTTPPPTPSTVTVTVSPKPVWPTETAKTIVPPPVVTTSPTTPSGCVQDGVNTSGWDTEPDESGSIYPIAIGPLAPPSISTGPCFDKLVFTVRTFADVEFNARYVPVVTADGSGVVVNDIKGSKYIQLTIRANMLRDEKGNPLYNTADYNVPDAQGFGNLRELRLVTPDYEGYITFGIGVDTMTPFAVEAYHADGEFTNVVVYIARPHR